MSTDTKIGLGSALSALGALAIALSLLLGWTEAPTSWVLLLGFVVGLLIGLGAALTIVGLIERRRAV